MKTFTLWILLFSLFSFFGCSLKGTSDATLKITLGAQIDSAQFPGRVMLWGKTVDGSSTFGELLPEGNSGEIQVELPNGTWNFYVVGWGFQGFLGGWVIGDPSESDTGCTDNNYYTNYNGGPNYLVCSSSTWVQMDTGSFFPFSAPMTGTVKCASSFNNELNGGQIDVDLNMSNANCDTTTFAPVRNAVTSSIVEFPKLWDLHTCTKEGFSNIVSNASNCNDFKGLTHSYRIRVPSFRTGGADHFPIVGGDYISPCFVINTSPTVDYTTIGSSTPLNLPWGSGDTPFLTVLEAYMSEDCSGVPIKEDMPHGFNDAYSSMKQNLKLYVSGGYAYTYHTADTSLACGVAGMDGFQYGDGSANRPYGICSADQLNQVSYNINNGVTGSSSAYYMLLRDIDMTDWTNAISTALQDKHGSDCFSLGSNFLPFGGSYTGSRLTQDCAYGANDFNGDFNGMGHAIKNLWFEEDDGSNIGLIGKGVSVLGVHNLILHSPQFSGSTYVGSIIGMGPSSGGNFNNIYIFDGEVKARSGWGGSIAGDAGYAPIDNVHAFRSSVFGDGTNIGGIAGSTYSGISNSSFHGRVKRDDYGNGANDFGGIVGTSATVSNSLFEGAVICPDENCTNVGLISTTASTYDNANSSANHAAGVKIYGTGSSVVMGSNTTGALDYATSILSWENSLRIKFPNYQPCIDPKNRMNIIDQINNEGRGTALNPISLCSYSQWIDMKNYSDKVYAMNAPILLGYMDNSASDNRIPDFTGTILGNGRMLYGGSLTRAVDEAGGYLSLFKQFHGTMQDFSLIGFSLSASTYLGGPVASLVGQNFGTISNVRADMIMIDTNQDNSIIGGVVAENSGVLEDVSASGQISLQTGNYGMYVGGVVGKNYNTGVLKRVRGSMGATITDSTAMYPVPTTVGGVAAYNAGGIYQVTMRDAQFDIGPAKGFGGTFGGLVGINDGVVQDSMVSEWSHFDGIHADDGSTVSAVVGSNGSGGLVNRVFFSGIFSYSLFSGTQSAGTLAGSNAGTVNGFYVNSPMDNVNGETISSYSCSAPTTTITLISTASNSFNVGDQLLFDRDGLRQTLFNINTAVVSGSSTAIVIDTPDCTMIDNAGISANDFVNVYRPVAELSAGTKLAATPLSDINTYSNAGWSILAEMEDQPIPEPIIQAHLNNDVTLGPVWILQDYDGPAVPSLFWTDFN